MKKTKLSELPICTSLKGLFTLGTDENNRSVRVSLEFIKSMVDKAKAEIQSAIEDAKKIKKGDKGEDGKDGRIIIRKTKCCEITKRSVWLRKTKCTF